MNAETLNCPMCGAATSTDEPLCKYCGSRLATVACASCFGMMFIGSRHCHRCGAAAAARQSETLSPRSCPRCRVEMPAITIGSTTVRECEHCVGLWVDIASFEKICADREEQAAVLGTAFQASANRDRERARVNYVPCPECQQLMNRVNFARCSGVIVDICKGHGTWFDCEELSRIVEFIRGGGLTVSREKEKAEIVEERQRLRQEQKAVERSRALAYGFGDHEDNHRLVGIASASELLKLLVD